MSDLQLADYQAWLKSLKTQIQAVRQRAVLATNLERKRTNTTSNRL